MDSEELKVEVLLEEYRQLRSEIMYWLDLRHRNKRFAMLIALGVLSAGVGLELSVIPLIGALVISFLWYDEIRRLRAIFRNAAYIEVHLESQLEGLNWETQIGSHVIQTSFLGRLIANAEFPILYLAMTLYGLITLPAKGPLYIVPLGICFGFLFLILIVAGYRVATHGRKRAVDFWRGKNESS
ncbi:MAG TPA: hypothetical protein VM054_07665 [bacterium]|nr:hypothetical protein [bacterium]